MLRNLSMLNDDHYYKLVLLMPVMRIRILIGMTVVRIRILICTTVVRIRILIGTTVVRIARVDYFIDMAKAPASLREVSIHIKSSQKTSVFTILIISSP